MSGRPIGSRFVFVALALTLLLAILLGVDALITGRYHRSVAVGVLHGYAELAAAQLESRITLGMAQRVFPIVTAVAEAAGAGREVEGREAAARADTAAGRLLGPVIRPFRIGAGPRSIGGDSLDAGTGDIIGRRAAAILNPQTYFAMLWLPGGRVAAFRNAPDGSVVGFLAPEAVIRTLLGSIVDRQPLLPPPLTGGAPVDSAVGAWITAGDQRPLLGTVEAGAFVATRALGPMWGDIRIGVRLREAQADRLIVGGLPRSRLPIVLTLLGLSVVLVAAAAVQLRRERDLTRLRDEFVSGASHELRTPIAQIRLFVETLRLGRIRSDEERDRALEIVDRETNRLSQMIENLLAVSRVSLAPDRPGAPLDVGAETRTIVERFRPLAETRGAAIAVDAEAATAMIGADDLERIVVNLLDNAVKYGPVGQQIRVAVVAGSSGVRVEVEDEGPGVAVADRERIFERFVRLSGAGQSAERIAGTGLGLALVREIVTRVGGRCGVEPGRTGGARFVIELPR